jgi:hypothetical protein
MSEHAIERSRHLGEIQGLDQQGSESALPAAFTAEEAPELFFNFASAPRRLVLERA